MGDGDTIWIKFRKPVVRPGTPEAERRGCRCRFESNLMAGFLTAERGMEDEVFVVIHEDCPIHEIVTAPPTPAAERADWDR